MANFDTCENGKGNVIFSGADGINLNDTMANSNVSLWNFNKTLCNKRPVDLGSEASIPLYSIIFVLSVVGNSLVILTLVQNKRMRTVTNVLLVNLSLSDLLLAAFCMPFTLIPQFLQNFVFGDVMCVLLRYLQAVSVGTSCFTLVTISLERYFAICQPLHSRRWQTLSHVYKAILAIWITSLFLAIPIAVHQQVIELRTGSHACREIWGDVILAKAYSVLLDIILLVMPLVIMAVAHGLVVWNLWLDVQYNLKDVNGPRSSAGKKCLVKRTASCGDADIKDEQRTMINGATCLTAAKHSNFNRALANKKRVMKMLFVVVLEYFVCWSPLYTVQTWKMFDYASAHNSLPQIAWSLIQLLGYISSCIHPVTYCFMNRNFRKGFATVFKCCYRKRKLLRGKTELMSLPPQTSVRVIPPSSDGDIKVELVNPSKVPTRVSLMK